MSIVKKKKLLFIVNTDWFFVSHRLPIAIEAINQGYEVHLATDVSNKSKILNKNGINVHPLKLHRSNSNIASLILEFKEIFSTIRMIRPDILHLVTIKPVLLGGIASRLVHVPALVYAVSGLGFVFLDKGFTAFIRRKIIFILYRISFSHFNKRVIFQNKDDQTILSKLCRLTPKETCLIKGSGIDLSTFSYKEIGSELPIILFASRLLKDKGVKEFVMAAKSVNKEFQRARFVIVGEPDFDNPSSVIQEEIDEWKQKGEVELWGHRENMNMVISQSTIVVLPSYREGLPKILIEASACGRAIITTDVPGCRDAIKKNITGILVPVQNQKELANKITYLLDRPELCMKMGLAGRKYAEECFDINKVVDKQIHIYDELSMRT